MTTKAAARIGRVAKRDKGVSQSLAVVTLTVTAGGGAAESDGRRGVRARVFWPEKPSQLAEHDGRPGRDQGGWTVVPLPDAAENEGGGQKHEAADAAEAAMISQRAITGPLAR